MSSNRRRAGIILHPASLPSPDGIGDFGRYAFEFVDFLQAAGMSIWQILPLGPTGYGDSPYTSVSSFAGNPLFISLEHLAEEGLIEEKELADRPEFPLDRTDYQKVYEWKPPIIRRGAERFLSRKKGEDITEFQRFCDTEAGWLDDYAFFMTAKAVFDRQAQKEGASDSTWNRYWPKELVLREPDAMEKRKEEWRREIAIEKVIQFFFFRQWMRVKAYANKQGIQIFGDIPIFVSLNSADVWAHPELFKLDKDNQPSAVAGVPPDYFSSTGQRWGNPLYRWVEHQSTGFTWWTSRIRRMLELTDMVRIDHFRGFEACWEIPAEEPTAVKGKWKKSPGREFFKVLQEKLGELPIVAEDLGVITPEVDRLRRDFGFHGMKVLQFAFESDGQGCLNPDNPFLPHNYLNDCVVYTGTHDNDTTAGWFGTLGPDLRNLVKAYIGRSGENISWELIRVAFMSVAADAIIPFQDVLRLGSDARMNTPGTVGENWTWRVRKEAFNGDVSGQLHWFARLYNRS